MSYQTSTKEVKAYQYISENLQRSLSAILDSNKNLSLVSHRHMSWKRKYKFLDEFMHSGLNSMKHDFAHAQRYEYTAAHSVISSRPSCFAIRFISVCSKTKVQRQNFA